MFVLNNLGWVIRHKDHGRFTFFRHLPNTINDLQISMHKYQSGDMWSWCFTQMFFGHWPVTKIQHSQVKRSGLMWIPHKLVSNWKTHLNTHKQSAIILRNMRLSEEEFLTYSFLNLFSILLKAAHTRRHKVPVPPSTGGVHRFRSWHSSPLYYWNQISCAQFDIITVALISAKVYLLPPPSWPGDDTKQDCHKCLPKYALNTTLIKQKLLHNQYCATTTVQVL